MFVTNCISTTKIQKISEITNFFRHYFLSRTEVYTIKQFAFLLFFLCNRFRNNKEKEAEFHKTDICKNQPLSEDILYINC